MSSPFSRFLKSCAAIAGATLALSSPALASTTDVFTPSNDVTIRGGVHANTNFNGNTTEQLSTMVSSNPDDVRRISSLQ
jgi:hypothetical protein